jgi:molecular chaperone GrpE (heat shock protein)
LHEKRETNRNISLSAFYISALVFSLLSLMSLVVLFNSASFEPMFAHSRVTLEFGAIFSFFIFLILAVMFYIWPALLKANLSALLDFPEALSEVSSMISDIDHLRKEHYRLKNTIDGIYQSWQGEMEKISLSIEQMLKRMEDIDTNLLDERQKNGELTRHINSWIQTSIDYITFFERTLSIDNINEDYKKSIEKSYREFRRLTTPLGLDIIKPDGGDKFDERIHEYVSSESCADIDKESVIRCIECGFRIGPQVLKKSKVVISVMDDSINKETGEDEINEK